MKCFLDRDGIFNYDDGYVGTIERFRWYENIFIILSILKSKGCSSFIVITNQSGIGRGYYSEDSFVKLSKWMCDVVEQKVGIKLKIVYCPHKPEDNCKCRKPKTGMFEHFIIDQTDIMIGDKSTDMLAAKKAGIKNRWLISTVETKYYSEKFASHDELIQMLELW